MVTLNLPVNPKNWLERLSTDETSEKLDEIHPEVIDFFKILKVDKLEENTRAIIMDSTLL